MLKSLLLCTAVVLLVIASASTPARSQQEPAAAPPAKKLSPDAMAKAKKVYNLDCAMCHGATGDGKSDLAKDMQLSLMDWTDPKSLAGKTDQQLFDEIRKGSGKMPPEDDSRAKNEEIRYLVQYIRSFAKEGTAGPATPAPPAGTPGPAATPSAHSQSAPPASAPSPIK